MTNSNRAQEAYAPQVGSAPPSVPFQAHPPPQAARQAIPSPPVATHALQGNGPQPRVQPPQFVPLQHPQPLHHVPHNSHQPVASHHAPPLQPMPPATVGQSSHGVAPIPQHQAPAINSHRPPAAYQAAYQPPADYVPSKTPPLPELPMNNETTPIDKQEEPPKKRERKRDAKDGGRDDVVELALEALGGLAKAL